MADPFEVRQRFTTLLSHLSASHNSLQKATGYALKNREMDEDLHSCILEQLERTNMNTRANIMFFVELLCETAVKENGAGDPSAMGYVRMLQRDILAVVECVVGVEGANVRVVRKVLQTLQTLAILLPETVSELDAVLKSREVEHPFTTDSPANRGSAKNGQVKMDKAQVMHRIEEDRERHKRQRETIWAVPGEREEELDKLWEEASDIGEDDYVVGREDQEERKQAIEFGP